MYHCLVQGVFFKFMFMTINLWVWSWIPLHSFSLYPGTFWILPGAGTMYFFWSMDGWMIELQQSSLSNKVHWSILCRSIDKTFVGLTPTPTHNVLTKVNWNGNQRLHHICLLCTKTLLSDQATVVSFQFLSSSKEVTTHPKEEIQETTGPSLRVVGTPAATQLLKALSYLNRPMRVDY